MNQKTKRSSTVTAFTLVELLVVIGIIALLLSILLPVVTRATKAARTVADLANLRSIGQAMTLYATENHNYILGSPNTSGRPAYTNSNSPDINQNFDWASPVMNELRLKVRYSATANANRSNGQARWDRVSYQLALPLFHCPENQAVCTLYQPANAFGTATSVSSSGVNVNAAAPYWSYSTGLLFMVVHNPDPASTQNPSTMGNQYGNPPADYFPKLTKLGNTTKKIFLADGARYVRFSSNAFDMDFAYASTEGGTYADWGAYCSFANGRQRDCAPGNGGTGADGRVLWARHGYGKPGGAADTFKFNAVFYDGHAETLGDREGANPIFWAPKGTVIQRGEFWPDVLNAPYLAGIPGDFTVPE